MNLGAYWYRETAGHLQDEAPEVALRRDVATGTLSFNITFDSVQNYCWLFSC